MDAVNSVALRLPFEMKHKIALHCERGTLARLARIHSTWISASEAALYESISTCIDPLEPCTVELLRMLAHQPRKATLVRSCSMAFSPAIDSKNPFTRLPPSPEILSLYCDVLGRMINLTTLRVPMLTGCGTFYSAVLRIVRSGFFQLKSLLIPDEASGGFAALEEALVPHTGTLRSIGLIYSHTVPFDGNRSECLKRFADRYSTFALAVNPVVDLGVRLYPILDASSPMWDTDLYVRNVQQAVYNRDDVEGPKVIVTCLLELYTVVPRVLRHIAESFPNLTSLTVRLVVPTSKQRVLRIRDADCTSAWVTIIASLAPFGRSLTSLVLAVPGSLNEGESHGFIWGWDLAEDEDQDLLRHVAVSCVSVRFVTLPTRNEYRYDPDVEDGWSIEYDDNEGS